MRTLHDYKYCCLVVLFCCICSSLFSQSHTEDFVIDLPEHKIAHSLYNSITFLDSREDTTQMGIVQKGAFNRKVGVVTHIPMAVQLSDILTALTDETAANGHLLFQLRQLSFAEITNASGERGYCYVRAVLYAKENNLYREIAFVDTVILIRAIDVTRPLFKSASYLINDFIASSLTSTPAIARTYSFEEVVHIDSIEKQHMLVYNSTYYPDGYYASYYSFVDMVPDGLMDVDIRKGIIYSVTTKNDKGKLQKLHTRDVYALVYNGQPYIATPYGYYPLRKENNDFFFTGKASVSPSTRQMITAGVFFGMLGVLMTPDANATFDMKLDHLSGGFIRLKEVKANYR